VVDAFVSLPLGCPEAYNRQQLLPLRSKRHQAIGNLLIGSFSVLDLVPRSVVSPLGMTTIHGTQDKSTSSETSSAGWRTARPTDAAPDIWC